MNALRPLLFLSLVSLTVLATCGGGGSKDDPVALCKQGCNKYVDLCASEFAGVFTPAQAKAACESGCTSTTGGAGMTCTNSSAMIAGYKACQGKTTCESYQTCLEGIPACEGGGTGTGGASGTGTGGASGTGGRSGTGTGGASGTGTGGAGGSAGASCMALMACCNATTDALLKTVCSTYYTQVAAAGEDACAQALTTVKAQGACP